MKAVIGKPIRIGYEGEALYREIEFDLKELGMLDEGLGTVILSYKRPDGYIYPIEPIVSEGIATWIVSEADAQTKGYGEVQLRNQIDQIRAKSCIFDVIVKKSIGSEQTPPDPYESWLDQIISAKDEAIEAEQKIENMTATASIDETGDTPTVVVTKTETEESFNLDFAFSGISSSTYIHNQIEPSDTWTISHNLGKYPSVSVVDTSGTIVAGDVNYVDNNRLTISFIGAFSGKAYLN